MRLSLDLLLDHGRAVAVLLDDHGAVHAVVAAMTPAFVAAVVAMHADFTMHAMFAVLTAYCAIVIAVADTNIDVGLRELDAVRRRTGGEGRGCECEGGRSGHRESKRFHV